MAIAYINIGTNLGDRFHNINVTIDEIEKQLNTKCTRSDFFESEAWGFESANLFINIAIAITIKITPQELLEVLQGIERIIGTNNHRNPNGSYADRIIDIDIMAIDDITLSTPTLTIPHRHLFERPFFYTPLAQIAPKSLIQKLQKQ